MYIFLQELTRMMILRPELYSTIFVQVMVLTLVPFSFMSDQPFPLYDIMIYS
jgi:hypothetical protein